MNNMNEGRSIEDIRRHFDCIIGYEAIKDELVQICDTVINREYYKCLGADIPHGILLYGHPGVGKTTLAECIADACGRPVFRIRKQASGDDFIGCIKKTFEEATKCAPSLILLDDLDKYSDMDDQLFIAGFGDCCGTDTVYSVLQSCIDDVEDKEVLIVATSNRDRDLPDSLIRNGRFDRVRTIYPPSVHDAELILGKYLGEMKLSDDVDYRSLAVMASGSSCAYIETIANDAGIIAGSERSPEITMDHIARAYLRWYSCKICEALTPEEKRRVAYHEAGHIVIMEHLMPGVMDIVSAQREHQRMIDMYIDGLLLGIHDDRNRMAALKALGGRAAIEVVYGEVDDMSEGDLSTACFHATEKVRLGYDEYMCLIQSGMRDGSSDAMLEEIENEAAALLEKYYEEALEIIAANRSFLERLADALCDNEYLLKGDIQKLKCA